MREHEGSKCGVLLEVHNLNRMKNGITCSTVRIPHESKNIILQRKCHYRDISQAAPRPVVYGPQKQVSLRLIFGKDATPCFSSSTTLFLHFFFVILQFL